MKQLYERYLFCFLLLLTIISCNKETGAKISLEGEWTVKLDSLDVGEKQKWFEGLGHGRVINLPGTLDENGIGRKNNLKPKMNDTTLFSLARNTYYTGKAWYQKIFELPKNWGESTCELTLERVIWMSKVWINGNSVGTDKSLSVPHVYEVSRYLKPGKNLITILIDNSYLHKSISFEHERYPTPESQGFSHAYSNQTQGKWNGIIGELSLRKVSSLADAKAQLYPDIKNRKLTVEMMFPEEQGNKNVDFSYKISQEGAEIAHGVQSGKLSGSKGSITINLPDTIALWDEFNPALYQLDVGSDSLNGHLTTVFGIREVANTEGHLTVNGKRVFLRGTLECGVFPIKGRPEMTINGWKDIFQTIRSYGFNHIRFHSWCPPKAAFNVADQMGFYLQVELPHWSLNVGEDNETNKFLESELERILEEYGNHPSFLLMSMGNELEGDFEWLNELVKKARKKDSRRLYSTSTFSFQKGIGLLPQPEDDFFVTQWTDKGWIRGQGYFNNSYPRFDADYADRMAHITKPLIAHEIGQYAVYPNLSEIEKYTGVMKPLNFMAIKNDLEAKGMLELAPKFTEASGKLAALLYKEDIERALKTPGFDGFQMLQLQDYPGHGTALVGLLDVFWDSKGIIDSTSFCKFNGPVVPLLRFKKAVFKDGDSFEAAVQVANFKEPLVDQTIQWALKDGKNKVASGEIKGVQIGLAQQDTLGWIRADLKTQTAKKLMVSVSIAETNYSNDWPIWVFPNVEIPKSEVVFTQYFDEARKFLSQGKKVLLNPALNNLIGEDNRFGPVFWSQLMFKQPPNMGILCDPSHDALAYFPTDSWSDWQWWDLCTNSKAMVLDSLKVDPIIRVIDDFTTNRNLGVVFEAKLGKGMLVFSSIDLFTNLEKRPEAKQLKYSLMQYMNTPNFEPKKELDFDKIQSLIKTK